MIRERQRVNSESTYFAGHAGVDRTFDRLIAMVYHWEYMRDMFIISLRDVRFVRKMSQLETPIHTTPFTTAAYEPWERYNHDSIGPLTLTDGSVCHTLVAIDCFSRWDTTEMKTVSYHYYNTLENLEIQHKF